MHAFGYTGRYLDRYYFFAIDDTFARTLFTFILDDFTFAAAGRAGGTCLHGAQNGLLVANDGAGTFTGRTGFASSIAFGTGAVAVGTGDVLFQFEFLFYTSRYFFQVELHLDAEVGTTETTLLGATSSAKTTETAKASSVSAEDVAEMVAYAEQTLRALGYKPYYLYRQKYMSGSFENVGWSRDNLDCP